MGSRASRLEGSFNLVGLDAENPGAIVAAPRNSPLVDGLGDGENSYGMQATAEILSQNYNLSRAINDKVAFQSFKRAYDASEKGLYKDYIIPMKDEDGEILDRDEAGREKCVDGRLGGHRELDEAGQHLGHLDPGEVLLAGARVDGHGGQGE